MPDSVEDAEPDGKTGAAAPLIELPGSCGGMAGFLGPAIETVTRQITHLRRAGILVFSKGDRQITLLDRGTVEDIALR